jgi:hypothetical protein
MIEQRCDGSVNCARKHLFFPKIGAHYTTHFQLRMTLLSILNEQRTKLTMFRHRQSILIKTYLAHLTGVGNQIRTNGSQPGLLCPKRPVAVQNYVIAAAK